MRIVSEKTLDLFRAATSCSWCNRPTPYGCHAAHLKGRGMGSGSRADVKINLISLCPACHHESHQGREPTYRDLLEKVAARENVLPGDIEAKMLELRNAPKPHKKLRKARKR